MWYVHRVSLNIKIIGVVVRGRCPLGVCRGVCSMVSGRGFCLSRCCPGGYPVQSHSSPCLPSSVVLLFGSGAPVQIVLCLLMAFVMDMNFIRCVMPFSVLTSLSSWVFLPMPSRGRWLRYFGHSLRMCRLVCVACPHAHDGSSVLMNRL